MAKKKTKKWTYEKAGVPHLKADVAYNKKIKNHIQSTKISGVMGDQVGFAALFDTKKAKMKDPLIVTATDGVGTKLDLALLQGRHDTIGIDLVAMCVNDLVTCGAKPFMFLDYYATGRFNSKLTESILKGIAKGCRESGSALVGGETAIMPGFYGASGKGGMPQYDLAGFSVGLVDRKKLIDGKRVRKGDVLLGIASSGVHSNGFSLVRKIFTERQLAGDIGKKLLKPTVLYVKPVLDLIEKLDVRGLAHITGGGLPENLPRVLPKGVGAEIDVKGWRRPALFELIQDSGNIPTSDMWRTFNMGIGMVVILPKKDVAAAKKRLQKFKLKSWVIGKTVSKPGVHIQ